MMNQNWLINYRDGRGIAASTVGRRSLRGPQMSRPRQKASKIKLRTIDEISTPGGTGATQRDPQDPCDREPPSYEQIFDRYIDLGLNKKFEERDREFKNRKSAAPIFGKSANGLDHMIEDGRVACIRVGATWLIHIPTSSVLLRQGKRWECGPSFPKRPKTPRP
jgi:hypothetical protein